MIKENQRHFNQLNILTDILGIFLLLPLAFYIRFYILPGGIISVPLSDYLILGFIFALLQTFTYFTFGLYRSLRRTPLRDELANLWRASALDIAILLGWLFVGGDVNFSRWVLAIFCGLYVVALTIKRIVVRQILRTARKNGYNRKHVILVGSGDLARKYLKIVHDDASYGYSVLGYVGKSDNLDCTYLGTVAKLEQLLEKKHPDEVVAALDIEEYSAIKSVVDHCEKAGIRLVLIPMFADYLTATPSIDDFNGLPMVNLRQIPLDSWVNALWKRAMDIIGSSILLVLTSPVMLVCAIGVKLSSPGPVLFRQVRSGLQKQPFTMYKFRSMAVNDKESTGWSTNQDSRKTKWGAFLRKFSLDELPQFWNVLKGDMSLVGPRPELPFFVDQFKDEIPLYMVRHQVRPGITGWAQVHNFRGDTSIKARIEHDIYYIERWSLRLDIQILLTTLFGRKFVNDEQM